MEIKKTGLWTLACMVLAVGAHAQQPGSDGVSPEQQARAVKLQSIEADRSGAAEDLVSRWQGANAALGSGWEAELRQVAGKATAESLLAASEASTYQAVVDALLNGGRHVALPGEKALGDDATDLVYIPVTPCRIVDTRTATGSFAGRIVAGTPRAFAHNQNIVAQGGDASGSCGIPTDPAAIAVTVTSVSPLAAGNLIGYQTGLATAPTTSINNYAVVSGLALANTTILPTGQVLGNDFNLAVNGGSVHAVVDVVGYFWSPVRPNCQTVTASAAPATSFNVTATCATSEVYTGGGCNETNWITGVWWWQNGPSSAGTGHTCRGNNTNAGAAAVTASARCCILGR
jgi:hypothetical protein